jgi:tetratricopeptide (TPR) repeat protein
MTIRAVSVTRRAISSRATLHRAVVTLALFVAVLSGCERPDPRLEGMINLEPQPASADRIAELEELVEQYGDIVGQQIDAGIRQADALKLLGQEYLRQQLFGPGYDTLQEAIRFQPENHVLHYLAGAAAGVIGKSQADLRERERYLRLSERSYLRAIELEPEYTDALYGLGVLYAFELNEPLAAIRQLDKLLERNDQHIPALFVIARSYVAIGSLDDAVSAYDRIIEVSPSSDERERAERNRTLLLGGGS